MFERRSAHNVQRGRSPPCLVTPENTTSQLIGSKVIIKTADGDYQGVVKHVWGDLEKISLSKVTALPSLKTYFGVHNFFKQDIIKLTLVETSIKEKNGKKNTKQSVKLQPLPLDEINGERIPKDTHDDDEDDDNDDVLTNIPRLTPADVGSYSSKGPITWSDDDCKNESAAPLNLKIPLPRKYCVVDEINEDFQNSIADINSSSIVGLAMDCNKGRHGELSIICASTSTMVYLFDIMSLGTAAAFDKGLRSILESEKITKVIHDCRLVSDVLYHLCKVKLANVFDTQVGDVIIYLKEHQNRLPQYCSTLTHCLTKYLKPDMEFLPRDEKFLKNLSWWKIRPLPPLCLQNAIRNVIFLQGLRQAIVEEIFADLTLGVSIYLNAVRNASVEELALNLGSPQVLPPGMACLTKHEMKFLHPADFENNINGSDNLWTNDDLLQTSLLVQNNIRDSHHQTVQSNSKRIQDHNWTRSGGKHSNHCMSSNSSRENDQTNILEKGVCDLQLSSDKPHDTSNSSFPSGIFENIKWTSDYRSVPKNKLTPAGKI